jgi:hypothetical protein
MFLQRIPAGHLDIYLDSIRIFFISFGSMFHQRHLGNHVHSIAIFVFIPHSIHAIGNEWSVMSAE